MKYALAGIVLIAVAVVLLFWTSDGESGKDEAPSQGQNKVTSTEVRGGVAAREPELLMPDEVDDASGEEKSAKRGGGVREGSATWTCAGSLAAQSAREVIVSQNGAVRSCYERVLKTTPGLEGSVTIEMRVGSDGRVDGVRFGGSLRNGKVNECIRRLAKTWRFPAVVGGDCAVISAPFAFSPQR